MSTTGTLRAPPTRLEACKNEYTPRNQRWQSSNGQHAYASYSHETRQSYRVYNKSDQRSEELSRQTVRPPSVTSSDDSIDVHEFCNSSYSTSPKRRKCKDRIAAIRAMKCFKQRAHQIEGRILRGHINRRQPLNRHSLDSILAAADSVIFDGKLAGRVKWEWSRPGQQSYEREFVGTTALRRSNKGGIETLIVLSEPLLRSGLYHRNLILSAFLHELVHCYMFIVCDGEIAGEGGHTKGFKDIARLITKWTGNQDLYLCHMEADLSRFTPDTLTDHDCGHSCTAIEDCTAILRSREEAYIDDDTDCEDVYWNCGNNESEGSRPIYWLPRHD